jgi:ferritin-like metal-binding protein YciE
MPPISAFSKSKPHAAEHCEMTRHEAFIAWARELGREDSTSLLQQNLKEEDASAGNLVGGTREETNGRQRAN